MLGVEELWGEERSMVRGLDQMLVLQQGLGFDGCG